MEYRARLKAKVFKTCDSTRIISGSRASTWAGGMNNLPVPAKISRSFVKQVFINNRWWEVDPLDWAIVDKGDDDGR